MNSKNEAEKKDGKPKIVIIEDETIIAYHIRLILEEAAYNVIEVFSNTTEFFRNSINTSPDLVIMNVVYDEKYSGFDDAERFRQNNEETYIIFLTGENDKNLLERLNRFERSSVVLKPFTPDILLDSVNRALRHIK